MLNPVSRLSMIFLMVDFSDDDILIVEPTPKVTKPDNPIVGFQPLNSGTSQSPVRKSTPVPKKTTPPPKSATPPLPPQQKELKVSWGKKEAKKDDKFLPDVLPVRRSSPVVVQTSPIVAQTSPPSSVGMFRFIKLLN